MPKPKSKNRNDPDAGGYEWFMSLSDAQKDDEVSQFERPVPLGPDGMPGEPLTSELRRQVARAKRRGHTSRTAGGGRPKRVVISVEQSLLDEADRFAKARHLNRTELIAAGLRLVMGKTG